VALLPTILILGDAQVHIGSLTGSNVIAHIETSVDKHFSIATTLYIPYVNPNDSHVGFWKKP